MKLLAVILMSMLVYATGELEYLKFELYSIYDTEKNEWIPIKDNNHRVITEVNVLQEITGDDWTLEYSIRVGSNFSGETVVKFCDTAETLQEANIIELFMKTLGLENQGCPIEPQTITNPEQSIKGYLELDDYHESQWIQVEMLLMKGDRPLLLVTLTT